MIRTMELDPSIPLNAHIKRADVRDGRARFRQVLDAVNAVRGADLPDARPTSEILRTLGGEGECENPSVDLGGLPATVRVVAVPGYLTECIAFMSNVLTDGLAHLESLGAQTTQVQLAGRGGPAHNAKLLRDQVMALPEGETVIVVAMSKGAVDTLEMFVAYPETVPRVRALVSLVGAVWGSPLYHFTPKWLKWIERHLPLPTCARFGGAGAESLAPEARAAFMSANPLPPALKTYTLGGAVEPAEMSSGLMSAYRALAAIDPLTDGQMLLRDQVVPESEFLGVLNGDHIAVGMPFNRSRSWVTRLIAKHLLNKNAFPREVMLEAAVRRVLEDL